MWRIDDVSFQGWEGITGLEDGGSITLANKSGINQDNDAKLLCGPQSVVVNASQSPMVTSAGLGTVSDRSQRVPAVEHLYEDRRGILSKGNVSMPKSTHA